MAVTPRIGARLHILDRILQHGGAHGAANEKLPRRRVAISTLLRLEHSETLYSSGALAKSTWQVRDRMEFA